MSIYYCGLELDLAGPNSLDYKVTICVWMRVSVCLSVCFVRRVRTKENRAMEFVGHRYLAASASAAARRQVIHHRANRQATSGIRKGRLMIKDPVPV